MEDFSRIILKQGCEQWSAKINGMSKLYQEAEQQTVKKGLRKAALISINPKSFEESMEKFNKDNLVFTPLDKTALSQGFSYLVKPPKEGELFLLRGCLTKNFQDGQIFKEAYQKKDDRLQGNLLGYPNCCINYFIENFSKNCDPIWLELEGKIKGSPESNLLLRYFGVKTFAHFSCLPNCQATQKIAEDWFNAMKEIDKKTGEELYNLLAEPMSWSSYHKVVQIETPYFLGLSSTHPYLKKPRIIEWETTKHS